MDYHADRTAESIADAMVMLEKLPPSRARSIAQTKMDEAMMWLNRARPATNAAPDQTEDRPMNRFPIFYAKPIQVQAHQVSPEEIADVAEWCGGRVVNDAVDGQCIMVPTEHGDAKALLGDWVLRNAKDALLHFYICSPEAFADTFAPVKVYEPTED